MAEGKIRLYLLYFLLAVFGLFKGGEFLALLALVLYIHSSLLVVQKVFKRLCLENLILLTVGFLFTIIAVISMLLLFFGFKICSTNLLLLSVVTMLLSQWWHGENKFKLNVNWRKTFFVLICFLISFGLYIYPALPSWVSPCTCGFDCTLHIEYSQNIYALGYDVPPVLDWRYYPSGFHTNVAFLTHAFDSNMPTMQNFIYPYAVLIMALAVAMLCSLIYERVGLWFSFLFLAAVLSLVYPANALIGIGFWSSIFGFYYCFLFTLALVEWTRNKTDGGVFFLVLLAFGGFLAYQILVGLFIAVEFVLVALFMQVGKLKPKLEAICVFLLLLGFCYGLFTLYGYIKYINYAENPISTLAYFKDKTPLGLNTGGQDIQQKNGVFHINNTGLHVNDAYINPHKKIIVFLQEGINLQKFKDYLLVGRENLTCPSGYILFYDLKWYGLLPIILMLVSLLNPKQDIHTILLTTSIIYITLFTLAYETQNLNSYYHAKAMYLFIYILTYHAIIGLKTVTENLFKNKKQLIITIILLILVAYSLGLHKNLEQIFGIKIDLIQTGDFYWSYIEFNRFQRWYDMIWGIPRENHGLKGWIQINKTT